MKLALIRQRYTPYGGAERFLERTLTSLGRSDLDITVIANQWPANLESPYHRILLKPFSLGRSWRDAAFTRAACHAVAEGKFDLVQSHERLSCCDIFRAGDGVHREWLLQRARRRGELSRILDWASPFHRRILAAEQAMFASPRVKTIICNSSMVRDEITHHYGVAAERLVVIPNAVNNKHFHPGLRSIHRVAMRQQLDIKADHPVFLLVGSGFERKGVDILLDLWPEMEATLIVVGHDRHLSLYRKRSKSIGNRVHLVGAQQDVRPWLGMADVFVLPTLYDPLPNAALEALACGLPVLTTPKCGAAEWINCGINGDVADALDHSAWQNILNSWCDPTRAWAAAPHALAAVASLSPQAMEILFRDLYSRLLGEPSQSHSRGSKPCSL